MPIDAIFRRPFAEQLAFFRAKLNLPTARWDDIMHAAHDRAFVVAGAMKADLLADLRKAVDKAIADGEGIAAFRQRFFAIAARHGWTDYTGAATEAGRAWRTRVIYQTNLLSSHAAGRWQQLNDPDLLRVRPYWRYIHNDSVTHPRLLHKQWGDMGLTLRHDHPFWKTHFPPNGWNCFPGDTPVRCDALLGQRVRYSGKMVELHTALGHRLSVTANHPVLTRRGWVAAHEIQEGDELIGAAGDIDAALRGIVDHEQPPSRAEDLFETLAAQRLRVVPVSPDDFYGDALAMEGEIHVAGADCPLMHEVETARRELGSECGLEATLHDRVEAADVAVRAAQISTVIAESASAQHVLHGGLGDAEPLCDPSAAGQSAAVEADDLALEVGIARVGGIPGATHDALSPVGGLFFDGPAGMHAAGSVADRNAASQQQPTDRVTAGAALFRQLLEANAGKVACDQVVRVREFEWSGHVFDFTTSTGLILAGGVVVSNCRCRVMAVRGPAEGDATEPPEGWDALDPKTGAPVGLDKGWAYAPGASWHPDLDRYPYDDARRIVAEGMADGIFDRWLTRIARQVEEARTKPEYAALAGAQLAARLRERLARGEAYPVAVMPPDKRALLGVTTQVVKFSDWDAIKQAVSRRDDANFTFSAYRDVQHVLDGAELIVREGDQPTVWFREAGRLYVAVLWQTASGQGVFLKSLRFGRARDMARAKQTGTVLYEK